MPGTQRTIVYLESKFETGDVPTQTDFYDLLASFLHYSQVKQVSGSSTTDVMSQNAIAAAIAAALSSFSGHFVGTYATSAALISANPAANPGDYGFVDAGVGSDIQIWIWDDDDATFKQGGSSATPNASETVSGSSEEATDAEMTAGTAAGGAARLFVNPAKLAASKYLSQSLSKIFCVASGTDTYTGTFTPANTAIATGQMFVVKFANTNTVTNPTFNPDGLGAKTIVKDVSVALSVGDLAVNHIFILVYDGTNLQLLGLNEVTGDEVELAFVNTMYLITR